MIKKRIFTEQHKKNMSIAMKGIPKSEAVKLNLSIQRKGKRISPKSEFKKGMIPWNKGKKYFNKKGNSEKIIREKRGAYAKKRMEKIEHKNSRRHNQLKRKFGMTLEQYNSVLIAQNNVCAICESIDTYRALSVDHNHDTGKVRGLLCGSCNRGLGLFKDNTERLLTAHKYLKKYE
jgi:hypothetical protein